jgi:Dyggve-Melchior-Clausen syndrome protein
VQGLCNKDSVHNNDAESEPSIRGTRRAHVSFSALFECLAATTSRQQTALLLYTLLTRSQAFRQSLLVRSDVDRLVVPLLEQVFKGALQHVNHLYVIQVCSRHLQGRCSAWFAPKLAN